jgi:hypothetical protein
MSHDAVKQPQETLSRSSAAGDAGKATSTADRSRGIDTTIAALRLSLDAVSPPFMTLDTESLGDEHPSTRCAHERGGGVCVEVGLCDGVCEGVGVRVAVAVSDGSAVPVCPKILGDERDE